VARLVTVDWVPVRNLKVTKRSSWIGFARLFNVQPRLFPAWKHAADKNPGPIGTWVAMLPLKGTILCIDDHWNGLLGRKMLLEENGYEVLEATNGDEGLKLFSSRAVDAVILDYQMPGMNGDVVATKMKRVKSAVPIMLLSAYGPPPESKLKAVDTFLSKSRPPTILLSTLQHLLNGRSKPFFHRWLDHWRLRNEEVMR
jgi:CheY-like chemotaxis protein